jgi:hypothetical protein
MRVFELVCNEIKNNTNDEQLKKDIDYLIHSSYYRAPENSRINWVLLTNLINDYIDTNKEKLTDYDCSILAILCNTTEEKIKERHEQNQRSKSETSC